MLDLGYEQRLAGVVLFMEDYKWSTIMLKLYIALLVALIWVLVLVKTADSENMPVCYEIAPPSPVSSEIDRIKAYILEVFGTDKAIDIALCESGLQPYAYNPELYAKSKGITEYSSCGIFQHNDPRCEASGSEVYNWKYSVDLAKEKYDRRGWYPWKNCAIKHGLITG